MSFIEDFLATINGQRDQLGAESGGAPAPPAAAAPAAAAPAAAAPADPFAALAGIVGKSRAPKVGAALAELGQTQGKYDPFAAKEARRFGGKILGYLGPERGAGGAAGAVVLRGGKLWHVYEDGRKLKMDEGAVARALGIKPKVGELVAAHPSRGHHGSREGVAIDPVTGGVIAPHARRGGGLQGLEALTGGALGPIDPGVPEMGDMERDPSKVTYSRGGVDVMDLLRGLRR